MDLSTISMDGVCEGRAKAHLRVSSIFIVSDRCVKLNSEKDKSNFFALINLLLNQIMKPRTLDDFIDELVRVIMTCRKRFFYPL